MRIIPRASRNAFTLSELMVVMGLLVIISGIAYVILHTGLILFAKNTSMNVAHQEARMAMLRMQKELHLAISSPRLIDEDGDPVNNDGPAAGMSFQVFADGPFEVAADAPAGQNKVAMNLGDYKAKAGQRLVIANHSLEIDLAEDTTGTGNQTLTLAENVPYGIQTKMENGEGATVDKHVVGILTERITYRIKDGELLHTDQHGATTVLAREITSDKPFARPVKSSGNPNSRAIAAVNLATGTKGAKKKKFRSACLILNAEVPARAILCTKP